MSGAGKTPPLMMSFDLDIQDPRIAVVRFGFGQRAQKLVRFESNGPALRRSGDVLICLGLAPAMELGADLVIQGGASRELIDNVDAIQSILCNWYPGYRKIRVRADPVEATYAAGRGAGLFYSGGVDSSYSVLELEGRLDALVSVIGADFDPSRRDRAGYLVSAVEAVSRRHGLEPVIITTDIRRVTDRLIGWVEYHGAFLAAVRHLLADRIDLQFIASSGSEVARHIPWGSHPALDPLYGTPGASIKHASLLDRFSKLEQIVQFPHLMEHLRVCTHSDPNCGRCKKCTFLLHGLDALDAFDKAPTFSREHLGTARLVALDDDNVYLSETFQRARERDPNSQTAKAADHALRRYAIRKQLSKLFPAAEFRRKFKRLKRQWRYRRAASA